MLTCILTHVTLWPPEYSKRGIFSHMEEKDRIRTCCRDILCFSIVCDVSRKGVPQQKRCVFFLWKLSPIFLSTYLETKDPSSNHESYMRQKWCVSFLCIAKKIRFDGILMWRKPCIHRSLSLHNLQAPKLVFRRQFLYTQVFFVYLEYSKCRYSKCDVFEYSKCDGLVLA